jgi:predicted RND superfamily exporter protein
MAMQVRDLKLDYAYTGMMPDSDSISINLEEFKETFWWDANIILFGVQDSQFFSLDKFNDWVRLRKDILDMEGVESAYSISEAVNLRRSATTSRFEFIPIFQEEVENQARLDSMAKELYDLPIYKDLLYSPSTNVFMMVLSMDPVLMDSRERENIIGGVQESAEQWGNKYDIDIHFSGLPYIRSTYMVMIKSELLKFIFLAAAVTFILLIIFFRSLKAVIPSVLVVGMGVLWAFGTMVLMNYRITVLTGMIPPLIIVIGIPNCVFLLNKFHQEYRKHGNKIKALQRTIQKVGSAVFLTNLTTAVGFATFMVINNQMLVRFGIIASVNIMILFVLSVFLIPIFLSFLPPPSIRQIKHLDHRIIGRIIEIFTQLIVNHKKIVFAAFALLLCLSGWGISKMKTTGFIVDDIAPSHPLYADLKFFEKNVAGIMPLEFSVDTKKPRGVLKIQTLKRADDFQNKLAEYPELSRSLSVVDGLKFARQAYFKGESKQYKLPSKQEQNFILRVFDKEAENSYMLRMLLDSTQQKMRINVRVADIGVNRMMVLKDSLQKDLDHHFPSKDYRAILTGSSLTFTLGTHYLVKNLFVSLGLAIILISFFMAWMFSSPRMVFISIFPNLLPLLITAGIMGFFSISIKPSTILVFSIAFGISVDTAIHFLAKYRQELACPRTRHDKAVINALREVGVSIIYTVIILFFGFGIFVASDFGGTVAMGILTAITLLVAMFTNFLLVPSILLSISRIGKRKKSE